jgi:hypothetical protein
MRVCDQLFWCDAQAAATWSRQLHAATTKPLDICRPVAELEVKDSLCRRGTRVPLNLDGIGAGEEAMSLQS